MHGIILKICNEPRMIINPLLHNTGWLGKIKNVLPWKTYIIISWKRSDCSISCYLLKGVPHIEDRAKLWSDNWQNNIIRKCGSSCALFWVVSVMLTSPGIYSDVGLAKIISRDMDHWSSLLC